MKLFLALYKNLTLIFSICITLSITHLNTSFAQSTSTPDHAKGLKEQLISVELSPGIQQQGVLSLTTGSAAPTQLAVLFPGYPSGSTE